jgi:hypothetical protein
MSAARLTLTRLQLLVFASVLLFLSTSSIIVFVAWSGVLPLFPPHAVRSLQRPAAVHAAEQFATELLIFTENIERLIHQNRLVDAMVASLTLAETSTVARLFRPYVPLNAVLHGVHRDMYYTTYVDYADPYWKAKFMTELNRHEGLVWSHRLALFQTQLHLARAANLSAFDNFVVRHYHFGAETRDNVPNGRNPLTAAVVNMSLLNPGGVVANALSEVDEPPRALIDQLAAHVAGMRDKLHNWSLWEDELLNAATNKGFSVSFGNAAAVFVRALHECGVTHALAVLAAVLACICAAFYESYASMRREIDRKAKAFCDKIGSLRADATPDADELQEVVNAGLDLTYVYARACGAFADAPERFAAELVVHGGTTHRLLKQAMRLLREQLLPRLRVAFRTKAKTDAIVSFAGEERPLALELQTVLERSDVSAFVDSSSVKEGDEWKAPLHAAILHAACGVVFLSRHSLTKTYPLWELMLLMARFHEQTMAQQRDSDSDVAPLILVRSVAWVERNGHAQASDEPAISSDAVVRFLRPLVAGDGDLPYFARESISKLTSQPNECATKVAPLVLRWIR